MLVFTLGNWVFVFGIEGEAMTSPAYEFNSAKKTHVRIPWPFFHFLINSGRSHKSSSESPASKKHK